MLWRMCSNLSLYVILSQRFADHPIWTLLLRHFLLNHSSVMLDLWNYSLYISFSPTFSMPSYCWVHNRVLDSPGAQMVKNLPAVLETWVWSPAWEDPLLGKGMAIQPSILVWKIPWTEEPGGLQSVGSQRVGQDWATNSATSRFPLSLSLSLSLYIYIYIYICMYVCISNCEGFSSPK